MSQISSASYAPRKVDCPKSFGARQTSQRSDRKQLLGDQESIYLKQRRSKILPGAYHSYLANVELYLSSHNERKVALPEYVKRILSSTDPKVLPRVSLAVAGGAYRGAIYAAGVMNTLDGRNTSSVAAGTGGILQSLDYITGLSGSAWLLASWLDSELAPLFDLVLGAPEVGSQKLAQRPGWYAQYGLLEPTTGLNKSELLDHTRVFWLAAKYWSTLMDQVLEKHTAGFPISAVDLWGRILSNHFLTGSEKQTRDFFAKDFTQGLNQTFSGFADLPSFRNHTQPFPILTSLPLCKTDPGAWPVPLNSTQYEFTPYEFGSYDPSISAFIPTVYLGTPLYSGKPKDQKDCTKGFDNAGFVMGVSSNLFPAYKLLLRAYFNLTVPKVSQTGITGLIPNPFRGLGSSDYLERDDVNLELMDGGFGDEVTPYAPLLVGARNVETILAIDGTGDSQNYANGSSLIRTAERVALYPNSFKFPKVPLDVSIYTAEGLVHHPTFFGCDESIDVPLLIWIANSSPIDGSRGVTNTSTIQLTYPVDQTSAMMNEAIRIGGRGFPSRETISRKIYKDTSWPACLSCAIAEKARLRLGHRREGICQECFDRYCWKPSKKA